MPGTAGRQARTVAASSGSGGIRSIVQDRWVEPAVACLPMAWFLPLVAFSFVSSVTPGPNNILLWASGARFGLPRTVPHVIGTALGVGAMALAVAAGLGAVIGAVPEIGIGMKLLGTAYLLYLAYQVAGAGVLSRPDVERPLGVLQASAFQWINPKVWVFALGAVTTFRPPDLTVVVGSVAVAATMMAVVVPSSLIWAGAGGVLGRWLEGPRSRRVVSIVLAAMLVATVASVWL